MSIGLYDDDFVRYVPMSFNLDLMKLSAYYKSKKEIVVLAPELVPERYTQFFFVKDYNDKIFDKRIFAPNVEYRGHAFSGEEYNALPKSVELMLPDKTIYQKFSNNYHLVKEKNYFARMMNAEHFRLSLNGKTIWNNFQKTVSLTRKTQGIFVHDFNLEQIKDSFLALKDITNQMTEMPTGQRLGVKFPIQVKNEQQIIKWAELKPSSISASIQYNGLMKDGAFYHFMIDKNAHFGKEKLQYNITYGVKTEKEFLKKRLLPLYRQILVARSNKKKMRLLYKENFFEDEKWEELFDLFNQYLNVRNDDKEDSKHTFFSWLKGRDKYFDRFVDKKRLNEKREHYTDLFRLVRETNYEVFRLFYESAEAKFEKGRIIPITKGGL